MLPLLKAVTPTISAGILTANLGALSSEAARMEEAGAKLLHFDVMDGCFTPMLTFGAPLVGAVGTPLFKDVHLMIRDPLDKLDAFVAAGADILTVHVESCTHVHRVLQVMGALKCRRDPARRIVRGAALNPGTPVEALVPLLDEIDLVMLLAVNPGWGGQRFLGSTRERLRHATELIARSGREILLEIDGGVDRTNIADIAALGPDIIVTGSAVFDGKDPVGNARHMLEAAARARRQ